MDLTVVERGLVHDGREVDRADVRGFHERFDPWRARVSLEVVGPGWSIPIDGDYADVRRALRARFRDRPFTSDWAVDGVFPALVLGGPPAPWFAAACVLVLATVFAAGVGLGPSAAVVVALAWAWPLGSARPAVVVTPTGLRLGPAWTAEVPWHEVDALRATVGARGVGLRALTAHGVSRATVPRSAWPACRARLLRLGGLVVQEAPVDLDERYVAWRAWATGLPWGALVGVIAGGALAPVAGGALAPVAGGALAPVVGGAVSPSPFVVWAWGGLVAAALGFVGAAVEARSTGWRTGGIFWMTVAYALLLAGVVLAAISG